jgi:hypothetical protein
VLRAHKTTALFAFAHGLASVISFKFMKIIPTEICAAVLRERGRVRKRNRGVNKAGADLKRQSPSRFSVLLMTKCEREQGSVSSE